MKGLEALIAAVTSESFVICTFLIYISECSACIPDPVCNNTEAFPEGFTHVVLAAGLIPIASATSLLTSLTIRAPSSNTSASNNTSGLFIQPVIDAPISASLSKIFLLVSPRNLKSVYPAWSVPSIEAALQALKNSSFDVHLPPFISVKLQPCQPDFPLICGNIPISTHGLVVCSFEFTNTKPGSPNSLTLCISLLNSSGEDSSLTITAELFDLPLCGLSINQLPVFAFIISSSSGEKRQIVADLRTPPLNTASAVYMTISYT